MSECRGNVFGRLFYHRFSFSMALWSFLSRLMNISDYYITSKSTICYSHATGSRHYQLRAHTNEKVLVFLSGIFFFRLPPSSKYIGQLVVKFQFVLLFSGKYYVKFSTGIIRYFAHEWSNYDVYFGFYGFPVALLDTHLMNEFLIYFIVDSWTSDNTPIWSWHTCFMHLEYMKEWIANYYIIFISPAWYGGITYERIINLFGLRTNTNVYVNEVITSSIEVSTDCITCSPFHLPSSNVKARSIRIVACHKT